MTSPTPRHDHSARHPSRPHHAPPGGLGGPRPPGAGTPHRFTARSPEDLLAFVPLALGFVPEESVVVVALGRSGPQARVDLPDDVARARALGLALAQTCRRHGVERVAVIGYTPDPRQRAEVLVALAAVMVDRGLEVVDVLGASPTHWVGLGDPDPDVAPEARPYDAGSHEFRAEAVLHGLVVHGSRAEVAARLEPDPAAVAATAAALRTGAARTGGTAGAVGVDGAVGAARQASVAQQWARLCREVMSPPARLEASRRAELLCWLGEADFLQQVWCDVDRGEACWHLDHWIRILRATPATHLPSVAGVVAFLAWRCGNGALAWCALDRASAALAGAGACDELAQPLLDMVRALLVDAVSPLA